MLLALAVLAMSAAPAVAQQLPCGPTATVEASLTKKYGESIVGAGIDSQGGPLIVLTNPETGTFTFMVRRPDGMTCIIAGGTGFTTVEPSPPKSAGKDL